MSFYLKKFDLEKTFSFSGKIGHFYIQDFAKKRHLTHICNFVRNSWKIYCKLQFSLSIKKKEKKKKRVSYPFFHIFCFSEDVMSTFFFLPSTVLCHFHGELILCPLLSTPNIMISWIQFHWVSLWEAKQCVSGWATEYGLHRRNFSTPAPPDRIGGGLLIQHLHIYWVFKEKLWGPSPKPGSQG